MFERRLKIILLAGCVVFSVLILRLLDLQVVHADYYREEAARVLLRPATSLPFVRGRILDRNGYVLAADEPCWQVSVDYSVLCESTGRSRGSREYNESAVRHSWMDLAVFAHEPVATLLTRAQNVVERVERWRDAVRAAHGYDVSIREERMAHPIVRELDDQEQISARQRLAKYSWIEVTHGKRRRRVAHPAFGHVLGQLGPVTAERLANDPNAGDRLARLMPADVVGVSGVERSAEPLLRGRRGRRQRNRRGEMVENTQPMTGADVRLTLNAKLQTALYELMDRRLSEVAPLSPGGAIVVLDTQTREVLALVSYPGYDTGAFHEDYDLLRSDSKGTPLRFRAISNAYEPGSIVKPLTCFAGMGTGVIDARSVIHCNGYYDRERYPESYRCWKVGGTNRRKAHGDITVADAIAGSCNVFMYVIGDRVGPDRLCHYFDMAGFGRSTGLDMIEERTGINPTPGWLMSRRSQTATRGHARNFAIGQGELVITPLQAANLMAVYATGAFRHVSLVMDGQDRPEWRLPISDAAIQAVREGLFRVTNDRAGTANKTAHWTNDRYALCGKTGSATTRPTPTHYRVRYDTEQERDIIAMAPGKTRRDALDWMSRKHPEAVFDAKADVRVEQYWPPPKAAHEKEKHSHAWFAGYLQSIDGDGRPIWSRSPAIAFAVMIEFGGSGGHAAGPVAKEVAQTVYDVLGPSLNPDGANVGDSGA